MLIEVTSHMERTQQLSNEVCDQAESRGHTLRTMIDLASRISASRVSLTSGLRDAKHVFGQLSVDDNAQSLQQHRDALQVSVISDVDSLPLVTVSYSAVVEVLLVTASHVPHK